MTTTRIRILFVLVSVAVAAAVASFVTFTAPGQQLLDQFGLTAS
jgi:uncharacterized membrane protein YwzB